MKNMKYFVDFFKEKNHSDGFGSEKIYNVEIDKWLKLLYSINKNYYEKGKTNINEPKKRFEFLGEIKSIYYCHEYLHGKNFELEPLGANDKILDFAYEEEGEIFFIEVKSPSWEGEIMKNDDFTIEERLKRKKKLQYINGEFSSYTPRDAITDSIKNSLKKFKKNQKNILMITPNMNTNVTDTPTIALDAIIEDELTKQDKQNLISGIVILETILYLSKNKIKYNVYRFDRKKI